MSLSELYSSLNKELREIRLLRILPSLERNTAVNVELLTTGLGCDSTLPYNALSYVWGDARIQEVIRINGRSLEIGESLATALRYVRRADRDVVLWADAICINQDDIPERNHQVSMMGALYTQAAKVFAWLGPTNENSDLALDFISHWARFSEDPEVSAIARKTPMMSFCGWVEGISPLSFDEAALEALIKLSFRSYWRRVWIVQELQLASQVDIRCGERVVSLQSLQSACWWWTLAFPFRSRETANNRWASFVQCAPLYKMVCGLPRWESTLIGTTSPSKLYLLEATRTMSDLHVTDPRDKVFGLLGLLDIDTSSPDQDDEHSHLHLIRPAYHNSARVVHQNFVRYCMMTEKSLLVLRYCRGPERRSKFSQDDNLPSWVPDLCDFEDLWTNDNISKKDMEVENFHDLVRFKSENTVLVVKGIEVDQIDMLYQYLAPFWPSQDRKEDCVRFVRDILDGPLLKNDESPLHALIRLLSTATSVQAIITESDDLESAAELLCIICDEMVCQKVIPVISIGPGGGGGVSEWTCISYLLARAYLPPGTSQQQINHLVNLMNTTEDYALRTSLWSISEIIKDRSILFRTRSGKLGMGLRSLKVGDRLCFLGGYYRPLALRATHAGGFVYVGECRVLDTNLPDFGPGVGDDMREFEIY